jgi:2-oxoisovalerate dehydrogenase E1 component
VTTTETRQAHQGASDPYAPPTPDQLRFAYRCAVRSRSLEAHIIRLVSRGEVKFAIWGTGEEVAATAFALALDRVVDPARFGIVPHYRSGCLIGAWSHLRGKTDFEEMVLRQQFSRATDVMTGGRQMVYHLHIPEIGVLPVQSPVGMQLGKAAGYALGFRHLDQHDGVAIGIVGDGTTAEGDLHDAMTAGSVWSLPVLIVVTDNRVAISTTPEEGRGIKDFAAYAEGFGFGHFRADGRSFDDTFQTCVAALEYVRHGQRPALLHITNLPRFNGHSSAADVTFDLSQEDPLVAFGQELVAQGHLAPEDVLTRISGQGRDFFSHHRLGRVMEEEDALNRERIDRISEEPEPTAESIFEHRHAPYPDVVEPEGHGTTQVSYAGAIRAALDKLLANGVMLGQDVAKLGGVMQASAGLLARHPGRVVDAPLNEPLIVGVSTGLCLHPGLRGLPEIQFGDYSLNAMHWLVHLGNLHWSTLGRANAPLILRMPVDPFGGGAMYHSMSVDGYFTPIPGLVVCMPSTSWDAHGLLLTAGQYDGPVVFLEPKWMYRRNLGPAFPGEPTDPTAVAELKRAIMRGDVPELPDVHVPFGKLAERRAGRDCTVVAWGRAVWTAMEAAERLAAEDGVDVEVVDLRTLVPYDREGVVARVARTGRLVVAAEDRTFGGFVRQVQGDVVEALPGTPTRSVGQKPIPGIGQSSILENATVLTADDVAAAVRDVCATRVAGTAETSRWVAPRWFLG